MVYISSFKALIVLVCFVATGCMSERNLQEVSGSAFLQDEIPLTVVSILPAVDTYSVSSDSSSVPISGRTALTVMFSRPVIALGSDWGSTLDTSSVPFSLSSSVPGKLRWVTTYIARFDPDIDWPTDLEFELTINDALESWDGQSVSDKNTLNSRTFTTAALTMSSSTVYSDRASELTDGHWSPSLTTEEWNSPPELPPDASWEITFSSPVEFDLLRNALTTSDEAVSVTAVGPCKYDDATATEGTCAAVTFSETLQVDATYTLTLPEGSSYHSLAGPAPDGLSLQFRGLVRFQFVRGNNGEWSSRHLKMLLRHGLEEQDADAAIDKLTSLITVSPSDITWSLALEDASTVILNGDFDPSSTYTVSIASDDTFRDGFGLPLVGINIEFFTSGVNYHYQAARFGWSNTFHFDESDYPSTFKALYRGDRNRNGWSTTRGCVAPVSASQLQDALAYLFTNSGGPLSDSECQDVQTDVDPVAVQTLDFDIQAGLEDAGLVLYEESSEENNYSTKFFITRDSLSVSAYYSSIQQKLSVWVTSLDDAADVEGVSVTVYHHNWQEVTELDQGSTGLDGTVEFDISFGSEWSYNLVVVTEHEGKVTLTTDLSMYNNHNTHSDSTAVEAVADRKLYKEGDEVKVKGWIRSVGLDSVDYDATESVHVSINWGDRTAAASSSNHWEESSKDSSVSEEVQVVEGEFDFVLTVPETATYGDKWVHINGGESSYASTSVAVTIGDPRPPTVELLVETQAEFVSPNQPQSDQDVDNSKFDVEITTKSLTGVPVANAQVTLNWTVKRQVIFWGYWMPFDYTLPSAETESGTTTVTTGADGTHTYTMDPASLNLKSPIDFGDTVEIDAVWIGPTREVLTQSMSVRVAASQWSLDVSTSPSNPLPGYPFGVFVTVNDMDGNDVSGQTVTLDLFAWDGETALTPAPANGVIDTSSGLTLVSSCDAEASTGALMCSNVFALEALGKHVVIASVTDEDGYTVSSVTHLGKTEAEWEANPLDSSDSSITFSLDKSSYASGDTATLSFYYPRETGRLRLVLGSEKDSRLVQNHDVRFGDNSVEFPVNDKCTGGCMVFVLLKVPRQTSLRLLDSVPLSIKYDMSLPTAVTWTGDVTIPDPDRRVEVAAALDDDTVLPGETAGVTLTLTDAETGEPFEAGARVTVAVVDKAILNLAPVELEDTASAFEIRSQRDTVQSSHNTNQLFPGDVIDDFVEKADARVEDNPWWYISTYDIEGVYDSSQWLTPSFSFSYSHHRQFSFPTFGGDIMEKSFDDEADFAFDTVEEAMPSSMPAGESERGQAAGDEAAVDNGAANGGASAPASASTSTGLTINAEIRSTFETTPVWLTNVEVGSDGAVHVDLPMPDNVGTFSVRAYAATANHQFGSVETELVVRRPLSLQPSIPRIVRKGDTFECGFILTMDDVDFSGTVDVEVNIVGDGLSSTDSVSHTESFEGVGPHEVKFAFSADAIDVEGVQLQFAASSGDTSDAFEATLPVMAKQDVVQMSTSMAVQASESGSKWEEGIDLPETESDSPGSLIVDAGVGYLPSITRTHNSIDASPWHDGQTYAAMLTAALLDNYGVESVHAASLYSTALVELELLTHSTVGLKRNNYWTWSHWVDTYLQAFAVFIADASLEARENADLSQLRATWLTALKNGLIAQAEDARRYGYQFTNWNLLASARLVIGSSWNGGGYSELSWSTLLTHVDDLSVGGKASVALLIAKEDADFDDDNTFTEIVEVLYSSIRVQGRTAYVAYSSGAAAAADLGSQSLALMALTQSGTYKDNQLITKLASYVGQGSARWFNVEGEAMAAVALSFYDEANQNTNPDLTLKVTSHETDILTAEFTSANNQVATSTKTWDEIVLDESDVPEGSTNPPPLEFVAKGTGEVSIAASLTFVPAALESNVYRGIYVEKSIQLYDIGTSTASGPSTGAVQVGDTVVVTIQVTTPDDLQDVSVVDLVPGGLEPIDSSLTGLSVDGSDNSGGGYWYWRYFPAFSVQTRTDRVEFQTSWLSAGTHSVKYLAIAATTGSFFLPPAHAFVFQQPELMGLSGAGSFEVLEEMPAQVDTSGLPVASPNYLVSSPASCPNNCGGAGTCDINTGTCTCDVGFSSDDCSCLLNEDGTESCYEPVLSLATTPQLTESDGTTTLTPTNPAGSTSNNVFGSGSSPAPVLAVIVAVVVALAAF